MSESMSDKAFSTSKKSERPGSALTVTTARNMLPLVRRIVADLLRAEHGLAHLQAEQERLDRQRHSLTWPERSRRYHLHEEIAEMEHNLQDALAEMEVLGLTLLDPVTGRVGFPTVVNSRRAYFSWHPGEEGLRHWHFAGESSLRAIPASWIDSVEKKVRSRS